MSQDMKITIVVSPSTLYELMFALSAHIYTINGQIEESHSAERTETLKEIRNNVESVKKQLEDARKKIIQQTAAGRTRPYKNLHKNQIPALTLAELKKANGAWCTCGEIANKLNISTYAVGRAMQDHIEQGQPVEQMKDHRTTLYRWAGTEEAA